jgi:hypothetical protein
METLVGVFLDHEKAVIIELVGKSTRMRRVESGVEKKIKLTGGAKSDVPRGPMDIADDRKTERRRNQQLQRYYKDLAHRLSIGDRIFLFGPGPAKQELHKVLSDIPELKQRIIGIESSDKLTENQIVAKVRTAFKQGA